MTRARLLLASVFFVLLLGVAGAARAAITYEGAADAAGNASSIAIANPGAGFGSVMVAQIAYRRSSAVTVTPPAGWVQVGSTLTTANDPELRQLVYVRAAGTAEPGTYTWSFSGSTRVVGMIASFAGVDTMNPVDAVAGATGNGDPVVAPAVTTTAPNDMLVVFMSLGVGNGTIATPSGMLSDASLSRTTGTSSGLGGRGAYQTIVSAGDTGTRSGDASSAGNWAAHSIALRQSSGSSTACFADNFNRAALGSDWQVASNSGSFGPPRTVGNRLRMTDASNNAATAASLQRIFPAAGNFIQVEFDYYAYGGSGADGVAVIFSDASVTPQPGGYGGSLGYAQRTDGGGIAGFAGGWLGVGIDEYGNFSNPTEGRVGGPGFRAGSVAIRGSGSGVTGYRYLAGTGSLSGGVSSDNSSTPVRYRITIDARSAGQALVTVERDAGGGFSTLVATFDALAMAGQAAVPANLALSFTGSTGGSTNVHELDNLQACAYQIDVPEIIDHFRFDLPTNALTCEPATITVTACRDAGASCTPYAGAQVTLTPSGWVGGDTQTLTTGSADLQLWHTTPGTVTLGVAGSTPPLRAFGTGPQCYVGGVLQPSCSLSFADSGFKLTVPDLTSCKPATATIQAVRKADNTNACVANPALVSTTASVSFRQSYVNPSTGKGNAVSVNGTTLSSSGSYTPVNVNFNASAAGTLNIQYADAGRMQLDASYTQTVLGQTLTMTGSDQFASVPVGIVLYNGSLTCADASCGPPKVAVAGADFPLTAKAACWQSDTDADLSDNPATPNFQVTGVVASAAPTVVAPAGGASGTLSTTPSSFDFTATDNGVHVVTARASEVGVFRFATMPVSYLGTTLAPVTGPNVGRFRPARFEVSNATLRNRSDLTCSATPTNGSFTYLDEPFTVAYSLFARNAAGATTTNYIGAFAKLPLSTASLAYGARSGGTDLSSRLDLSGSTTGSWVAGVAALTSPLRLLRVAAPDGPYAATALGVAPVDSDTVQAVYDFDVDANGTNEHVRLPGPDASTSFVFGRLRIGNAYGSELVDLPVPVTAQAWDGARFVTHTADSCTRLAGTAVTLGNYQRNLNACETAVTPATLALSGGVANIVLPRPGAGNAGSVDLTLDLGATATGQSCTAVGGAPVAATAGNLPYLQGKWSPGSPAWTQDPSARASFGQYKAPLIYLRENF